MDTIFALASGTGKAGVSVIRISGKRSLSVLNTITSYNDESISSMKESFNFEHGRAYFRKFYNDNILLDVGIAIYFKSPKSYTGEDVVEFHIHGGHAVIQSFFSAFRNLGLRMAEPGEFTRRSFINGKQDIIQVEGVLDLINSETESQRKQAIRCLSGEIGTTYKKWYEILKYNLALIEAIIDFGDEIGYESFDTKELNDLLDDIRSHLLLSDRGISIKNGFNITIVGPTNVGKSSFINFLSKRDVAIVSDQSGTTRDIIEISMDLNGYLITISDTAGLRMLTELFLDNSDIFSVFIKERKKIINENKHKLSKSLEKFLYTYFSNIDSIEREGILRADIRACESDLLLLFSDDIKIFHLLIEMYPNVPSFCILNKIDKIFKEKNYNKKNFYKLYNDYLFIKNDCFYLDDSCTVPLYPISIHKNFGIDFLMKDLKKYLDEYFIGVSPIIINERHKESLIDVESHLSRAIYANFLDQQAEDIRLAMRSMSKILGKVDIEELLNIIFNNFCIGK